MDDMMPRFGTVPPATAADDEQSDKPQMHKMTLGNPEGASGRATVARVKAQGMDGSQHLVTVVENVYYQGPGIQPFAHTTRFQAESSGEQVYNRQEKVTGEWKEVSFGWVMGPAQIVIFNPTPRFTRVPSQEEVDRQSSPVYIGILSSPQEITKVPGDMFEPRTTVMKPAVYTPIFIVPAGQSFRGVPVKGTKLFIKTDGREKTVTVIAIPG